MSVASGDLAVDRAVDRAVILAAGLGTRLKWLTNNRPKALMELAGEPAIVRVIRRLAGQGVHDIAINVHHHAGRLMDVLGDGSGFGVRLYYSHEETLLDSGGGVRTALEKLPGSGPFVVHNADVVADIDLGRLARRLPDEGAVLTLVENPLHHPQGDFGLDGGRVVAEKASGYTYAGVSLWSEPALAGYEPGEPFPLTEPMRQLMSAGRLAGVVHRGTWFDIGRPRELMMARGWISREI